LNFQCPSDCPGDSAPGVKAFKHWQSHYLVHPDRRVYVRLEIHPYNEAAPALFSGRPYTHLGFKFIDMTQEEALEYARTAVRHLGKAKQGSDPSNANAKVTGGDWTSYSYIESIQRGGGIGQTNDPACKQFSAGLTPEEAEEEMTREEPPFCSWDSAFDTDMQYRALVMERLSDTAVKTLFDTVLMAPSFDDQKNPQFWNFYLQVDPSNGAAGDVAPDATPYPWRSPYHMTLPVIAKWSKTSSWADKDRLQGFNYLIISRLQPYQGTSSYYNYADDDMPGGAIPLYAYFGSNAERVLEIRDKYKDKRFSVDSIWELKTFRTNQSYGVQKLKVS